MVIYYQGHKCIIPNEMSVLPPLMCAVYSVIYFTQEWEYDLTRKYNYGSDVSDDVVAKALTELVFVVKEAIESLVNMGFVKIKGKRKFCQIEVKFSEYE